MVKDKIKEIESDANIQIDAIMKEELTLGAIEIIVMNMKNRKARG